MRKCGAKGAGGHARRGLHLTTTPSKQQRASLVMFGRWWSSQMRPMLKAASDAKGCTRAWLVARVWPPDLGTTRRYVRSEPILEGAASSVAVEWPLWRHPRGAPQQMWPASLCRNGEREAVFSYPPRPSLRAMGLYRRRGTHVLAPHALLSYRLLAFHACVPWMPSCVCAFVLGGNCGTRACVTV